MSFKKLEITKKGRELLAKASEGKKIMFTGLEFGDGATTESDFQNFEGLISKKIETDVTTTRIGDKVKVEGSFKNKEEGFCWREIGVWAITPDDSEGDILFAYQNAGDLAEFIPSTSSELVEKNVCVEFKFDAIANVEINIDNSMVYVTKKELAEKMKEKISKEELFGIMYPIGSLYMTTTDFDPSTITGEWQKVEGRYLLATPKNLKAGAVSADGVEEDGYSFEITKEDLPVVEVERKTGNGDVAKFLQLKENSSMTIEEIPPYFLVNVWHRTK